jgi:hypothetical protein
MRTGTSLVFAALAACLLAAPVSAAKRLTARDRAEISNAIDVFVNHAVKRTNPGAAYGVVDSNLRGGMTQREWSHGDIGVYNYPARGLHHPWTVDYYEGNEVGGELMLQPPRGNKSLGAIIFKIYIDRVRGRWLVDSLMPAATFAPAGKRPSVTAASDFGPGGPSEGSSSAGPQHINPNYAFVPLAALGGAILAVIGWVLVRSLRDRRPRHEPLPPLSIRADDARARPSHRT